MTKEMLETAMERYRDGHSKKFTCPDCAALGSAMYHSERWKTEEATWVAILSSTVGNPYSFVQAVRMAIKLGIGLGMELERLHSQTKEEVTTANIE